MRATGNMCPRQLTFELYRIELLPSMWKCTRNDLADVLAAYLCCLLQSEGRVQDGLRFVDCDMHILEPPTYLRHISIRKSMMVLSCQPGQTGARVMACWSLTACPHPWIAISGNTAQGAYDA